MQLDHGSASIVQNEQPGLAELSWDMSKRQGDGKNTGDQKQEWVAGWVQFSINQKVLWRASVQGSPTAIDQKSLASLSFFFHTSKTVAGRKFRIEAKPQSPVLASH